MIRYIVISTLVFMALICHAKPTDLEKINSMFDDYQKEFKSVPIIDPNDKLIELSSYIIVDVREPKERNVSFIKNSISKSEFSHQKDNYKNKKVLVYCTIGYRSGSFASDLKKDGFDAYNLKGGVLLWIQSGRGLINKIGETKSVHVYGQKWNLVPPGWHAIW
ncbi:MAG: rhodanese-like domain-containing protein [Bdellovibrionales bacterium]